MSATVRLENGLRKLKMELHFANLVISCFIIFMVIKIIQKNNLRNLSKDISTENLKK